MRSLINIGVSFALMATAAFGAANVRILHGIPGLDVSISVEGACAVPNFRFGDTAGPLTIPGATYRISIHPGAGCTAAALPAFENLPLTVADGQDATAVAHLGSDENPTISVFVNNLTKAKDRARIVVHHLAAAPDVDFRYDRTAGVGGAIPDLTNLGGAGSPPEVEVVPGEWSLTLWVAGTETAVLAPTLIPMQPGKVYMFYAIGNARTGQFDVKAIIADQQ